MIKLNQLSKIVDPDKRRLGRGHGSGRVKTSGRGTKGQKAKGKIRRDFEGGQLPLIKRLPLYRGKGRNKSFQKKSLVINLKTLNLLSDKTIVNVESLIKANLIPKDLKNSKWKILGDGEITKILTIQMPISKTALKKIEKAGGKLEKQNAK